MYGEKKNIVSTLTPIRFESKIEQSTIVQGLSKAQFCSYMETGSDL